MRAEEKPSTRSPAVDTAGQEAHGSEWVLRGLADRGRRQLTVLVLVLVREAPTAGGPAGRSAAAQPARSGWQAPAQRAARCSTCVAASHIVRVMRGGRLHRQRGVHYGFDGPLRGRLQRTIAPVDLAVVPRVHTPGSWAPGLRLCGPHQGTSAALEHLPSPPYPNTSHWAQGSPTPALGSSWCMPAACYPGATCARLHPDKQQALACSACHPSISVLAC